MADPTRRNRWLVTRDLDASARLADQVARRFGNVLTVILGESERLLHQLAPDDPLRMHVETIHESAAAAVAGTLDLIAFAGGQGGTPGPLAVSDVVAGLVHRLRLLVGPEIDVVETYRPGPDIVRADREHLEEVVLALASGARDAMPGGGRLTIETSVIDVTGHAGHDLSPGRYVAVTMTDTGADIDLEARARAFEPRFAADSATSRGPSLAAAHGRVRRMSGVVEIENAGRGVTAVRVLLPAIDDDVLAEPSQAAAPAAVQHSGATVLVVDDEDDVRDLVRDMLETSGYRVLIAHGSAVALRICGESRHTVDLLLTDIVMPGMNGLELARHIRNIAPRTRVLYMSGDPEHTTLAGGTLDAGMQLLRKPFDRNGLLRYVRSVLEDTDTVDPK